MTDLFKRPAVRLLLLAAGIATLAWLSASVFAATKEPTPTAVPNASYGVQGKATAGPGRKVRVDFTSRPPKLDRSALDRRERSLSVHPGPPTPLDRGASRRSPPRGSSSVEAPSDGTAPQAPGDLSIFRLKDLGSGQGSTTNEPSVGSNGLGILETWNWYAARSTDGGQNFTYINPFTQFPASYGGFCCDQVVQYDPSRDLYIWVLQYIQDGSGNNAERLVVAKGQAALAAGNFTYWDITPQQIGEPTSRWYDQPKIALTNNNLFMETSIYNNASPAQFQKSVVKRFSLDDLAALPATRPPYSYYIPVNEAGSPYFSPGLTQGATTTMHFAVHTSNAQLRIYSWADGSNTVNNFNVNHTAYPRDYAAKWQCPRTGAPATSNWCANADDRLHSGWLAGGQIGFSWTASQGSVVGGFGTFPYPYVHVVRVNASTQALVDEPYFWNSSYAFAHSSIAPNASGELGGTYLWGGGTTYENCGGLVRDSFSPSAWQFIGITSSNADPLVAKGGDYLSTRKNGGNNNNWSAACYALIGGGANSNTHTYYVSFGREQNSPFPGAPTGVSATAGDASATVSWTAPSYTGGNPITNYVVTPYIGAVAQPATTVGNVTSTTITGLTNGTSYTFKVAAKTGFGTGAQSAASNAVTPIGSGYPRPNGAAKIRVTLVPAHRQCTAPSADHGPPYPNSTSDACTSTGLSTDNLTVPNDDSTLHNAAVTFRFACTDGGTPPLCSSAGDQADVTINSNVNDVRCHPITRSISTPCGSSNTTTGPDYSGRLLLKLPLRITDRYNGPSTNQMATLTDANFTVGLPCTATAGDLSRGSGCSLNTSTDALVPGFAREDQRALLAVGQVSILDMGDNGTLAAGTIAGSTGTCPPQCKGDGDEQTFLRQGIFAP